MKAAVGVVKFLGMKNKAAERKTQMLSEASSQELKDLQKRRGTIWGPKDLANLPVTANHKTRNRYLQQSKPSETSHTEEVSLTPNQVELVNMLRQLSELNIALLPFKPKSRSSFRNQGGEFLRRPNTEASNTVQDVKSVNDGVSRDLLPKREPSRSLVPSDNPIQDSEGSPDKPTFAGLQKRLALLVDEILELMEKDEQLKKLFDTLGFDGPEDKKTVRKANSRCASCSVTNTTNPDK